MILQLYHTVICYSSDTLFELWNKYEPKLPKLLYQRKLLEMGDLLVSMQVISTVVIVIYYWTYILSDLSQCTYTLLFQVGGMIDLVNM